MLFVLFVNLVKLFVMIDFLKLIRWFIIAFVMVPLFLFLFVLGYYQFF